jgi:hypothetical protein
MFTRMVVSAFASFLIVAGYSVVPAQAQICKVTKDCACLISKDAMRALRLAGSGIAYEKELAQKENRPVNPAPEAKFHELWDQLMLTGEMVMIPKGASVFKTIVSGGGWLSVDDVQLRPIGSAESCWALSDHLLDCK